MTPNMLQTILPEVSYIAKTLLVAPVFVAIYAYGIYKIMNRATYKKYVLPKWAGEAAYERKKKEAEEKVMRALKKEGAKNE